MCQLTLSHTVSSVTLIKSFNFVLNKILYTDIWDQIIALAQFLAFWFICSLVWCICIFSPMIYLSCALKKTPTKQVQQVMPHLQDMSSNLSQTLFSPTSSRKTNPVWWFFLMNLICEMSQKKISFLMLRTVPLWVNVGYSIYAWSNSLHHIRFPMSPGPFSLFVTNQCPLFLCKKKCYSAAVCLSNLLLYNPSPSLTFLNVQGHIKDSYLLFSASTSPSPPSAFRLCPITIHSISHSLIFKPVPYITG